MRKLGTSILIVLIASQTLVAQRGFGNRPLNWFSKKGMGVRVYSPGCYVVPFSGHVPLGRERDFEKQAEAACSAAIRNENDKAITAMGWFWEVLRDDNSHSAGVVYAIYDFTRTNPENGKRGIPIRPNSVFNARVQMGVPDPEAFAKAHLHLVFVEFEDGSVAPVEAQSSPLYARLLSSRQGE